MRKIDRETRTRFQDTFDAGERRAEGEISAAVRRRPCLSGAHRREGRGGRRLGHGAPAGQAQQHHQPAVGRREGADRVALVFAIFDLNPAPFCLLDEVDAPLDENNVGRFCDIVRDMSRNVQFIFITHNKSTMELASQLVGVTMNEPGVSRLVAVDVDEAVRMAAM
jgi:chromosome segregation protein